MPSFLQLPTPWGKEPGSGELEKGWQFQGRRGSENPGLGCVSMRQQGSLSPENSCACRLTL